MEIGSLADWVGAAGGAGGALTAAYFYFADRRKAGLKEREDAAALIARQAELIDEVVRQAGIARSKLNPIRTKLNMGGRIGTAEQIEIRSHIRNVRRRLEQLKELAAFNPRLFSAIGNVSDVLLPVDIGGDSNANALAGDAELAVTKLAEPLNQLAAIKGT